MIKAKLVLTFLPIQYGMNFLPPSKLSSIKSYCVKSRLTNIKAIPSASQLDVFFRIRSIYFDLFRPQNCEIWFFHRQLSFDPISFLIQWCFAWWFSMWIITWIELWWETFLPSWLNVGGKVSRLVRLRQQKNDLDELALDKWIYFLLTDATRSR